MEDMITYLVGFMALGLVCKVCKAVRDIILTLIYVLGLLVALRFTLKYVLGPVFKMLAWVGKMAWTGFRELCGVIDRHFRYRDTLYMDLASQGQWRH